MTPEQITKLNAAIAEKCGPKLFVLFKPIHAPFGYYRENACGYTNNLNDAWKVTEDVARKYATGPAYENEPDKVVMKPAPIPNFYSDLNACHEAWLTLDTNQWVQCSEHLNQIVIRDLAVKSDPDDLDQQQELQYHVAMEGLAENATAAQRAKALAKTWGIWEEIIQDENI